MGHDKRPSAREVVKNLIAEDGWQGLYRGLGPRFFSMSTWGTSMILAYEYLSMVSFSIFELSFSFAQRKEMLLLVSIQFSIFELVVPSSPFLLVYLSPSVNTYSF